jgi:hypothetical protein
MHGTAVNTKMKLKIPRPRVTKITAGLKMKSVRVQTVTVLNSDN